MLGMKVAFQNSPEFPFRIFEKQVPVWNNNCFPEVRKSISMRRSRYVLEILGEEQQGIPKETARA